MKYRVLNVFPVPKSKTQFSEEEDFVVFVHDKKRRETHKLVCTTFRGYEVKRGMYGDYRGEYWKLTLRSCYLADYPGDNVPSKMAKLVEKYLSNYTKQIADKAIAERRFKERESAINEVLERAGHNIPHRY